MKQLKKMGIWMDHSNAIIMDIANDKIVENNIVSEFTHQEKEFSLRKSEILMHNKENHEQSGYYKKLSDIIRNYQEILLFGPTDAKDELLNLIKDDHLFANKKIEVKHADKMTENQRQAFVRAYFK